MIKISVNGKDVILTGQDEIDFEAERTPTAESLRIALNNELEHEASKRFNARRCCYLLDLKIEGKASVPQLAELAGLLAVEGHYITVKNQIDTLPDPTAINPKSGWPV